MENSYDVELERPSTTKAFKEIHGLKSESSTALSATKKLH